MGPVIAVLKTTNARGFQERHIDGICLMVGYASTPRGRAGQAEEQDQEETHSETLVKLGTLELGSGRTLVEWGRGDRRSLYTAGLHPPAPMLQQMLNIIFVICI